MKRRIAVFPLVVALSVIAFCGCGPANQLLVPAEIARPTVVDPKPLGTVIAVMDFSYTPPDEPNVIGRDSDRVRQIVWEGDPGRLLADLVAGALSERGASAFRAKEVKAGHEPDSSLTIINGSIRQFEVNIRRRTVIKAYIEATVEVAISVSGRNASAPWETSVSSNYVLQGVIPMSDDVRRAIFFAASSAADEAAKRFQEREATENPR